MRQLSKIIFIDSADIEHEEMNLDSNIHIQGDQGAGKTTTERAILFFYTADKKNLGIETDSDKKGFVEFYLPRKTSCIIYEVTRENGTFSILTYLKDNRLVWRIIDCPFEDKFLIKEDNILLKPSEEWDQIAVNIGASTYFSPEVKTAKDYLNIIYGNHKAFSNKDKQIWRRFSLAESDNYQSIVRILQNIFLDSNKLEAGEIKQTLINTILSGTSNKPEIKLSRYDSTITSITELYEDILKWFKVENGQILVRKQADEVTDTYHKLMACIDETKKLCIKLALAIRSDERRIPLLQEEMKELETDVEDKNKIRDKLNEDHKNEETELQQQLGELNGFIKKAEELQRKYADKDFQDVLMKVARKNDLDIQRESLDKQINIMLDKSKTLAEKYDAAIKILNGEITEVTNTATADKNKIEEQLLEDIQKSIDTMNEKIKEVDTEKEAQTEDAQKHLDQLNGQHNKNLLAIKDISLKNPYQEEMVQLQGRLDEENNELHQAQLREQELNREIEKIQNDANNEIEEVKRKAQTSIDKLQGEIEGRKKEIKHLNELLEQQNGSFIEWLDENIEGWEENIGKVVDEENILYRHDLYPEKSVSGGNTFFGVDIQLENIEKDILTPQKIKDDIHKMASENYETDKNIRSIQEERDAEVGKLNQRAKNKLAPLNKELREVKAKTMTLPLSIKKLNSSIEDFNTQLKEWRNEQTETIRREDDALQVDINKAQDVLQKIKDEAKRKVENIRKNLEQQKRDLRLEAEKEKTKVDARLKERTDEIRQSIETQQQQKQKALADEGVDTESLEALQRSFDETKKLLREIDILMPQVNVYNDKKREYIDHIDEKKEEKEKINNLIKSLDARFNKKLHEILEAIKTAETNLENKGKQLETIKKNIEEAKIKTELWGIELEYDDSNMTESEESVSDIVKALDVTRQEQLLLSNNLSTKVSAFSSNFSANNQFKFKTNFTCNEDYIETAKELATFVEENRIEVYKKQINTYCENFLADIRIDVYNLFQFNTEIASIISKINKDIENENFVNSINSIQLRMSDSTDPIMLLLKDIRDFYEMNQEHLHEMDLFTDPEKHLKARQDGIELLMQLQTLIKQHFKKTVLTIEDTFRLEVRVVENRHDSGWREIVKSPGSNGTSMLVLTIINITLLNVYKEKLCRKSAKYADLYIHCLLDEGGRLYEKNIEGLVQFASKRKIHIILVTPNSIDDVNSYKHHYLLYKEHTEKNDITRIVDLLNVE